MTIVSKFGKKSMWVAVFSVSGEGNLYEIGDYSFDKYGTLLYLYSEKGNEHPMVIINMATCSSVEFYDEEPSGVDTNGMAEFDLPTDQPLDIPKG